MVSQNPEVDTLSDSTAASVQAESQQQNQSGAQPLASQSQEATPERTVEEQLQALRDERTQWAAEKTKLEGDLKSAHGRRAPMEEIKNELVAMGLRIDDTGRAINVLSRSVATGDTTDLSDELDQIQQSSAQQRTAQIFSQQFNTIAQDVQGANIDDSENPMVDLETDERFENFRSEWLAARDAYDFVALTQAGAKAERLLGKIKLETQALSHQEALKAERKSREEAEGKLKAINPLNQDTSALPASNGIALDNLSPQEKIAQGLRREQDTGQRSTIWSVTAGS